MNKKIIISAIALAALSVMPLLASAQTITSMSPTSAPTGSGDTAIAIYGTDFASGAVVSFNGLAISTTYVSSTQLNATIPASYLATSGDNIVALTNPGGAPSNSMTFSVTTAGLPDTGVGPVSNGIGIDIAVLVMAIAAASAVLVLTVQAKRAYFR